MTAEHEVVSATPREKKTEREWVGARDRLRADTRPHPQLGRCRYVSAECGSIAKQLRA